VPEYGDAIGFVEQALRVPAEPLRLRQPVFYERG
jgi:hypothetical protein